MKSFSFEAAAIRINIDGRITLFLRGWRKFTLFFREMVGDRVFVRLLALCREGTAFDAGSKACFPHWGQSEPVEGIWRRMQAADAEKISSQSEPLARYKVEKRRDMLFFRGRRMATEENGQKAGIGHRAETERRKKVAERRGTDRDGNN